MPKVWKQMNREGIVVVRCTVERLMRLQDLHEVVRGKRVRTILADASVPRPLDRVNRRPTESAVGVAFYVCFDMARVVVYGIRDRRGCPSHRWRARQFV